jgi:hypothetical protein
MKRRCRFVWLALLALAAIRATAHPAPNSVVSLDFGRNFVRVELLLPTSELRYALSAEGVERSSFAADDPVIAEYLTRHVVLIAPDGGGRWQGAARPSHLQTLAGHEYLVAALDFTPPTGATTRQFIFQADPVTHEVRNHHLMVVARSDYRGGLVGDQPELIGFLQYPGRTIEVMRAAGHPGRGFRSAFALGIKHIATGPDHLLFLLTLLLPAAMVAGGGRWRARRGAKATLRRLVGIVSAFTVGHSISLIAAAASGWQVAAHGVETLIALSVLMSSIHAWRPIFPGREALVAGAFGLCHGLSFARALGGYLLDPTDAAGAILGFNLGIECFQLLIVLASIPFVVQLAPGGYGGAARKLLAAFSASAALGWLGERAFDTPNPFSAALGSVTMTTTLLIVGSMLIVGAGLSVLPAWRAHRAQWTTRIFRMTLISQPPGPEIPRQLTCKSQTGLPLD